MIERTAPPESSKDVPTQPLPALSSIDRVHQSWYTLSPISPKAWSFRRTPSRYYPYFDVFMRKKNDLKIIQCCLQYVLHTCVFQLPRHVALVKTPGWSDSKLR